MQDQGLYFTEPNESVWALQPAMNALEILKEEKCMDKDKLQQQSDIVENKLMQSAGYLTALQHGSAVRPPLADKLDIQQDTLGEALNALLEIKKELGLTSKMQVAKED